MYLKNKKISGSTSRVSMQVSKRAGWSLVCIIVTFVLVLANTASAAFDITSWQYSRPIETNNQAGIVKAVLPSYISWSTPDFRELRVIDERGGEVPFMFTRNITTSVPMISARLLNVSTQSDGSTRFIADVGQSGIVRTTISIMTASPNFRRQVSIYAADSLLPLDDSRWSLVTSQGYIFKFTDPNTGYTSGKNTIDFEANTSRYFKVIVSSGPEANIFVNGSSVQGSVAVSNQTRTTQFPASMFNDPKKRATEVTIDLGAVSLVDSVTLFPTDSNYGRRVIVEVSNTSGDGATWRYVAEGSISNISTSVFKGSSNTVNFSEQNSRFIRVSIVNDDNPPLSLESKAYVRSPVLAVIFDANSGRNYSLYYGNSQARQPQYDISKISSYIEEGSLPIVGVGAEVVNTAYIAPKGPVVPYTESHKALLNIVLVLVVLAIVLVIVLYLRTYIAKNKGQIASEPFEKDTEGQ